MPSPADLPCLAARAGLLVVSVLVLLGCVCGLPAMGNASVTEAPPGPGHASSHDGEGTHLASCEATTPKPMAPRVPGVGTLVMAWSSPVVVVARESGPLRTGLSYRPLFLLHAAFRI